MYFDFPGLQKYVDHFTLMTYDFRTPDRVPKLGDHASPFKFVYADRLAWQNIESQVNKAVALKADRNKLVLGISTYGRTWKMDKDSGKSGAPPVNADGPGEEGTYTKTEGLLAYYEICPHLVESTAATTSLTLYRLIYNNIIHKILRTIFNLLIFLNHQKMIFILFFEITTYYLHFKMYIITYEVEHIIWGYIYVGN